MFFYKSEKNMFFMFFYLRSNVFNICGSGMDMNDVYVWGVQVKQSTLMTSGISACWRLTACRWLL